MRKILTFVILAILFAGVLAPVVALAQEETPKECCVTSRPISVDGMSVDPCPAGPVAPTTDVTECGTPTCIGEGWGMVCLLNTVYNVTNWVFYLLMVIAVLMIIFGGATYMTAAGDPEKAGKGKSILTFAIIGLAIALIAKIIPSIVRVIVGM